MHVWVSLLPGSVNGAETVTDVSMAAGSTGALTEATVGAALLTVTVVASLELVVPSSALVGAVSDQRE